MGSNRPEADAGSPRGLEQLHATIENNRADIDALLARSDESHRRADESEARADRSEVQADDDRTRIDELERRAHIDRQLLAELQTDGMVNREQVAHLEDALRTSRTIGAAIGIVMANRRVDESLAFEVLKKASSLANRKLRTVAEDVVLTGAVDDLPEL